jgi:hypothetical protein
MPSRALLRWHCEQKRKLDQLEAAHKAVGGTGPGRRYLTQLNHACIVMLAAQWQDFCRNLHTEAADAIVAALDPPTARLAMQAALTSNRQLDRGNAGPGAVGNDFSRFGTTRFWDLVDDLDRRNAQRRLRLDQLHIWRNAVAHQDFNWKTQQRKAVDKTRGTLDDVRRWRSACDALTEQFDVVVSAQASSLVGTPPW